MIRSQMKNLTILLFLMFIACTNKNVNIITRQYCVEIGSYSLTYCCEGYNGKDLYNCTSDYRDDMIFDIHNATNVIERKS